MNKFLHYATCAAWETGQEEDCLCLDHAVWRIRKEPAEQFPWRIWRRTHDNTYEPMMRCSSWAGARDLVVQLMWLRTNALKREPR